MYLGLRVDAVLPQFGRVLVLPTRRISRRPILEHGPPSPKLLSLISRSRFGLRAPNQEDIVYVPQASHGCQFDAVWLRFGPADTRNLATFGHSHTADNFPEYLTQRLADLHQKRSRIMPRSWASMG